MNLIEGHTVFWRRLGSDNIYWYGYGKVLQSSLGDRGVYFLLVSRRDIDPTRGAPPLDLTETEHKGALVTIREKDVVRIGDTQPEGRMPDQGTYRNEN